MGKCTKGLRSDLISPRSKKPSTVQAGEQLPPNSARDTKRVRHVFEDIPPNSAPGNQRFVRGDGASPQKTNQMAVPPNSADKTPLDFLRLHSGDKENIEEYIEEYIEGTVEYSPRAASVISATDTHAMEDDEFDGDSVQVLVRIRPANADELERGVEQSCVSVADTKRLTLRTPTASDKFQFDHVLGESSTQEDVFELVGMPMVDHCLTGYNSSIFAYGQTGAGKTHTMLGDITASNEEPSVQRGLTPRVFDYLFEKISQLEDNKENEEVRYICRVSFLELYNETFTDLLESKATVLPLRENRNGCFVEGLSEHRVLNRDDVLKLMRKGSANRRVRETRLNGSSSRSHSVFRCSVERSSEPTIGGVTQVMRSALNLIDLAGSERVNAGAVGGDQAKGEHFKEAVNINMSLTTLGRVINQLSEAKGSKKGASPRHVPFRDSKLTFLLQDSLGGNAKTTIVANVSPACPEETASTLKFVQRAKYIKNRASINVDYQGDVQEMQKEMQKLNADLEALRKVVSDPAIQEAASLRETLAELEKRYSDQHNELKVLAAESVHHKQECQRLADKLANSQSQGVILEDQVHHLLAKLDKAEAASEAARATRLQSSATVVELPKLEAAAAKKELRAVHVDQAAKMQHQLDAALLESSLKLNGLGQRLQQVDSSRQETEREVEELQAAAAATQQEAAGQVIELQAALSTSQQEAAKQVKDLQAALSTTQQEAVEKVKELQAAAAAKQQEAAGQVKELQAALSTSQQEAAKQVKELQAALSTAQQESVEQVKELLAASKQVKELQAALSTIQQEAAEQVKELQTALSTTQQEAAGQVKELLAAAKQLMELIADLSTTRQEAAKQVKDLQAAAAVKQQESAGKLKVLQEALSTTQQEAAEQVKDLQAALTTTQLEAAEQVQELRAAAAAKQQEAAKQVKELQTALSTTRQEAAKQVMELIAALSTTKQEAAKQVKELQEAAAVKQVEAAEQVKELQATLLTTQHEVAEQLKELQAAAAAVHLESSKSKSQLSQKDDELAMLLLEKELGEVKRKLTAENDTINERREAADDKAAAGKAAAELQRRLDATEQQAAAATAELQAQVASLQAQVAAADLQRRLENAKQHQQQQQQEQAAAATAELQAQVASLQAQVATADFQRRLEDAGQQQQQRQLQQAAAATAELQAQVASLQEQVATAELQRRSEDAEQQQQQAAAATAERQAQVASLQTQEATAELQRRSGDAEQQQQVAKAEVQRRSGDAEQQQQQQQVATAEVQRRSEDAEQQQQVATAELQAHAAPLQEQARQQAADDKAMDVDQAAKMQHQLDAAVLESSLKLTGLGQHLQQVDGSRQEADQGVEKLQAAAATTQQEAAGQVIELTAALSTTQQEAAAQVMRAERRLPAVSGENLLQAIKAEDVAGTLSLLKRGVEVNFRDQWENTPLHYTASFGHLDCLRALLAGGAKVDVKDKYDKRTPLHWAARNCHLDCLRALVTGGATVDVTDNWENTPLHYAASFGHLDCLRALLAGGARVDVKDKYVGRTPLHYAAEKDLDCVRALMEGGAAVDDKDIYGYTPLDLAVRSGHRHIAEYLRK